MTVGVLVVVRRRRGHLVTTIRVPKACPKAVRWGLSRWQHCLLGDHRSIVTPVRDTDLTDEERVIAERHRNPRIPVG